MIDIQSIGEILEGKFDLIKFVFLDDLTRLS